MQLRHQIRQGQIEGAHEMMLQAQRDELQEARMAKEVRWLGFGDLGLALGLLVSGIGVGGLRVSGVGLQGARETQRARGFLASGSSTETFGIQCLVGGAWVLTCWRAGIDVLASCGQEPEVHARMLH